MKNYEERLEVIRIHAMKLLGALDCIDAIPHEEFDESTRADLHLHLMTRLARLEKETHKLIALLDKPGSF